jgi:tetratricopeptide (TPR) repeat protein
LTVSTDDVHEAWLRYVVLAIDQGDLSGLARLLEMSFSRDRGSALWKVAAETLVYLLAQTGQLDAAQKATIAILRGESFPPEGWRDTLRKMLPEPSPELVQEEERLSAPAKRPRRVAAVPTGRISSFGNQRSGFIEGESGETYFFRLEDVSDEALRQALLDGSWRERPHVEFTPNPSVGHKYQRAANVLPLQDVTSLLDRARRLLKLNLHSQAMALVRRVLVVEPDLREAQLLETEIKEQIRKRGIGLPKGRGPYARAKRAQLAHQDLASAEQLLRLAIKQGDNRESAIKDLASLLLQQGRSEEAVKLLESESGALRGKGPYANMLASVYQQLGRYTEAVGILTRLERIATSTARPRILRRIAFCQFKAGRYDEAERTLRALLSDVPGDPEGERWLAGLEEARRTGMYASAAEVIDLGSLAEEGLDLSPLARAAIDSCAFDGVEPSRLQAGTLTDDDVSRLEDLAKHLGTKRPRDRAAYYLSAAAILRRRKSDEDAARTYDYLRRYFASMGDAAWIDKRPADAVRTYYLESLSLVAEEGDEAWRTLTRYLLTFSGTQGDTAKEARSSWLGAGERARIERIENITKVIKSIRPESLETWRRGLLDACSQSNFFQQVIREAIQRDRNVRESMAQLLDMGSGASAAAVAAELKSRYQKLARARTVSYQLCGTLTRHRLTAASIEELIVQLKSLETTLGDLDRRRLSDLLGIGESALGFCRASDFEEREQHYWLVTTRVKSFIDQVKCDPTQFSHAALLPIAEHRASLVEEEYAETVRTSAAQLGLRLLVNDYPRLLHGVLKLQIELTNKVGCSPASNVRLIVEPEDSPYFELIQPGCEIIPALRGGAASVVHVALKLRPDALQKPAFPIVLRATYRNREGEACFTDRSEWTVRLYDECEFTEVPNRYAPYAEGGPVDDPEMFFGREELLEKLESSLATSPASKCIVVFGQKRAGKSSLLEHLRRRLAYRASCVPVQFSLYEIGPALDEATFFYRILQGIADALEDRSQGLWKHQGFVAPTLESMQQHPTLRFHETMSGFLRNFRRAFGADPPRLVLLIDEFTEVYKQRRKGIISDGFMRAWKAVVEKRYFASVLVGQDVMPAFKSSFPNEFGVTEDVRVTYLSEKDARRLIEEPVGSDRYVGKAVERILGLTAGSPYYTMMLCNRLVDYMNRTRSKVVTEADVAMVEQEMLSGDRRLGKDKFDNLICAGDGIEDSGIDPDDTFRLCAAIAREGERGWCSCDSLRVFARERLDTLLTDLERRDVVERKGEAVRLRVGLFRDWLLVHA